MKIWQLALSLVATASVTLAGKPNIVLIMTDDQGIGDFGVMGNELIETPHLDGLARQSASALAGFLLHTLTVEVGRRWATARTSKAAW